MSTPTTIQLQIFNDQVRDTSAELIAEQIDLFNAATRGALVLSSGSNKGDYIETSKNAIITDLIQDRDAFATGAVDAKDPSQLLEVAVKLALRAGPVNIPPGLWEWIGEDPDSAAADVSKQVAQGKIQKYLNKSIKALVAATSVQTALVHDATDGVMAFSDIISGAGKFGDRSENIVCWIMHSKVAYDLYQAALASTTLLFNYGTVNVKQDPFGRVFVITDNTALQYTSSGTKYHTLGLVPGAATVQENDDWNLNISVVNGDENIKRTYQAEWSATLGLKGYAWDKTTGGHSPTDAAIATGSNWDQVATSDKDLSGVMINSQ
jgi:hypothetical protein